MAVLTVGGSVLTLGLNFGNIVLQGYSATTPGGGATPIISGGILLCGLGTDKLITQGYGISEDEPEPEDGIVDSGIIRGATNDQNTHNGNAVILSGKMHYQVLSRRSGEFTGFDDLLDRYQLPE